MPPQTNFDILTHIWAKIRVFSGRPEIQWQILAIGISLFLAAIITRSLSRMTVDSIDHWIAQRRSRSFRMTARTSFRIIQMVSFPILGLSLTSLASRFLSAQGYITGLIDQFGWVLLTVLAFQLVLAFLYTIFDAHEVQRYHHRLLLPLLIVVVALEVLSDLVNLQSLAQLELVMLFERPITLGAIFIATVGLYFWTDAIHGVQELVYRIVTRRTSIDPGSTQATLTLVRYVLIILGILFAFSQLRLDSTTIAAITGGLSVGVGFGMREILSNFVSGLLLLFERSLHPGDVIEVDGELCVVKKFSIRATTVRTLNNIELVIPNQAFFTDTFKTYTGTDRTVRIPLTVKTDCEIDPRNVQLVIQQAVLAHEQVLNEPEPSVFILEYLDNVATFQVNIWIDNPLLSPKISSEVRVLIWDAFDEHGIALPTPEYEVHFSNRKPLEMATPRSGNGMHRQQVAAVGSS